LAKEVLPGNRRPVLDVRLPGHPQSLWNRLDALIDDYKPFAIEDVDIDITSSPTVHCRRFFFFSKDDRDQAFKAIEHNFGTDVLSVTIVDLLNDNWAERSFGSLRAVRIGDLIVTPPWDRMSHEHSCDYLIEIDPSMGFGTGHHASTRLMLKNLLEQKANLEKSRHVLDIGTGSGVLAIASVLLGANSVTAVERDIDALTNARQNIARNGVSTHIKTIHTELSKLQEFHITKPDIILANLTGAAFQKYEDVLEVLGSPSGLLMISGLTDSEEQATLMAFEGKCTIESRHEEEGWVCLVFRYH
tara:strand:+ start:617 stop:1522 length:906 start_codon:yes stop_codon:yes gene_type:complete